LRPKNASADFQNFVGWRPKNLPKVLFFFGLEGALFLLLPKLQSGSESKKNIQNADLIRSVFSDVDLEAILINYVIHYSIKVLQCNLILSNKVV